MRPRFPKCGACELMLPLKEGSCELKISKFGGLRAEIWAEIEAVVTKISNFVSKGGLLT